jgi:hypothetical protein
MMRADRLVVMSITAGRLKRSGVGKAWLDSQGLAPSVSPG